MMSESSSMLEADVRIRCSEEGEFETSSFTNAVSCDAVDRPTTGRHKHYNTPNVREFKDYTFDESNSNQKLPRRVRNESSEEDEYFDVDQTRLSLLGSHAQDVTNGKPLLRPRSSRHSHKYKASRRKHCLKECVTNTIWTVLFLLCLGCVALGVVYLMNRYWGTWLPQSSSGSPLSTDAEVEGCSLVTAEPVWTKGFPKLMTESALRLVDVNADGVDDIIMGFATGGVGYKVPEIVCDIYFNGTTPCMGGVLALDGATGEELWTHFSDNEIYGVNCNHDLNGDGITDCLAGGRIGLFEAVSGRDGRRLWRFQRDDPVRNDKMNLYTGVFVPDLNGDGVPEVVNIHGGDPFAEPGSKAAALLLVFSGRTGAVLQAVAVPDGGESYYSPVTYQRQDGTLVVVFGTGGETLPGSLWYITVNDLYKGDIGKAKRMMSNAYKGFMTPPVLVDLTKDGVVDLIVASFNSTVTALDGETYVQLWNFTYPWSETYATPSIGYYNDDDVPDFAVHLQYGPGFPLYYHSITTVVDGRDGTPLLKPYIRASLGAQTSPLTVSVQGRGNDLFLYWVGDCLHHEAQGTEFSFIKGTNVHEQSRSDFCRLTFKTEGYSELRALSRHTAPPGVILYNSVEHKEEEKSAWINTTQEALRYVDAHPSLKPIYDYWKQLTEQSQDILPEEDEDLDANHSPDSDPDSYGSHPHNSGPDSYGSHPSNGDLDSYGSHPHNSDPDSYGRHPSNSEQDSYGRHPSNSDPNSYERHPSNTDPDYNPVISGVNNPDDNNPDMSPPLEFADLFKSENQPLVDNLLLLVEKAFKNSDSNPQGYYPDDQDSNLSSDSKSTLNKNNELPAMPSWQSTLQDKLQTKDTGTGNGEHSGPDHVTREKRHVGIHDAGGLQRLVSTGTLAPSLLPQTHPDYGHTMDYVYAVYWFYPAKTVALLPADRECVRNRMQIQHIRFDPKSPYYGMDEDAYEHKVTHECLDETHHEVDDHGTYNSKKYNPFDMHMGQMTVYRTRLKCACPEPSLSGKPCSAVLPHSQQMWGAYMGTMGTSHVTSRP